MEWQEIGTFGHPVCVIRLTQHFFYILYVKSEKMSLVKCNIKYHNGIKLMKEVMLYGRITKKRVKSAITIRQKIMQMRIVLITNNGVAGNRDFWRNLKVLAINKMLFHLSNYPIHTSLPQTADRVIINQTNNPPILGNS